MIACSAVVNSRYSFIIPCFIHSKYNFLRKNNRSHQSAPISQVYSIAVDEAVLWVGPGVEVDMADHEAADIEAVAVVEAMVHRAVFHHVEGKSSHSDTNLESMYLTEPNSYYNSYRGGFAPRGRGRGYNPY
jgi:hypothetical protein